MVEFYKTRKEEIMTILHTLLKKRQIFYEVINTLIPKPEYIFYRKTTDWYTLCYIQKNLQQNIKKSNPAIDKKRTNWTLSQELKVSVMSEKQSK